MAEEARPRRPKKVQPHSLPTIIQLSTKGQLTIPQDWRSRHHLAPGSPLSISEDEQGRLVLTPLPPDWLTPSPELQALVQGLQEEMQRRRVTPQQLFADLEAIRQQP
jgi:AbrB family looped-hinge helix DNA binding protein